MKRHLYTAALAFAAIGAASPALSQEPVTVAYFQEWPMPFQFAKVQGTYEEQMGVPINWVAFESGTAMSAAMAAGNVQIAVSQGVLPFIAATSAGQDLKIIDIAGSYAGNENCVVAAQLEIDKDSAAELEGKRVAVPMGTGAQYTFLQLMEHLKVDATTMSIVDMAPAEGAAALSQGNVDMACGWGGALARMQEYGNVLLSGAEKEAVGILSFDLITTTGGFAAEQPQLLANFVAVTAQMNAMWNAGEQRDAMLPVIAQDAGMDEAAAGKTIDDFVFLPVKTTLSDDWLGGRVGTYLDGAAAFFHDIGTVPTILPSYGALIDTGPLADVASR